MTYEDILVHIKDNEREYIEDMEMVANEFLENNFGMALNIPIKINNRTSRAIGSFWYKGKNLALHIDISRSLFIHCIMEKSFNEVWDVLKHELIHYALFSKGLPFSDSDYMFKKTCTDLGVSLTNTLKVKEAVHIYTCNNCGHVIPRNKKDIKHYHKHKNCGGAFTYKGKDFK